MISAQSRYYLSILQEEGILQKPYFSGITGPLSKTKFIGATCRALAAADFPAKDTVY